MRNFSILMVPAQNIHDPDVAVTVQESINGVHEARVILALSKPELIR
jgi:hypothetical protein